MLAGLRYGAPRWLVEALGMQWRPGLLYNLRDKDGIDHLRTYKRRVVVAQPYEASGNLGVWLVKLTQQGICIRIWGISPYYPCRTFSIVIWRKEDEELALEVMKKMSESFKWSRVTPPTMNQWT